MANFLLYSKFSNLPQNLRKEVEDFIDFLTSKNKQNSTKPTKPKFGSATGSFKMKKNFNDSIDDFKDFL
jgi:hypothetical protein